VLVNELRAPLWITPRPPASRLDQDINPSSRRYTEKAKTEQATELANARIALGLGLCCEP
jgi:hypothetical protein